MNATPTVAGTTTPAAAPANLSCRQPDTRAVPLRRLLARLRSGTADPPTVLLQTAAFTSSI